MNQDQLLELFNQRLLDSTSSIAYEELADIFNRALQAGGKRVRPMLCLLGAELVGGRAEHVLDQAVGLELFHTFSLIHDDIMDEAPLRRGRPSIYQKFGRDRAILSGDVMLIISFEFILSQLQGRLLTSVFVAFNRMAIQICEGQMRDLAFEGQGFPSQTQYLKMIEQKTSVLLGTALQIGALIGGADAKTADQLYQYGVRQGMAFQIQDDILDVYGLEKNIGKRVGGDILQGKKTLLTVLCYEKAKKDNLDFESLLLTSNGSDENKIEKVKELYEAYNIKVMAESLRDSISAEADLILEGLDLDEQAHNSLNDYMKWLTNRNN